MRTVEMHPDDIQTAARVIPEDQPVVVLNLFRYRAQADYGGRTDIAPCSGREALHERYIPAFNKVAADVSIVADGIHVVWFGTVLARVLGPADEQWDEFALVEYPNFAAFQRIVESPHYTTEANVHRLAALEDSRLIVTVKMS